MDMRDEKKMTQDEFPASTFELCTYHLLLKKKAVGMIDFVCSDFFFFNFHATGAANCFLYTHCLKNKIKEVELKVRLECIYICLVDTSLGFQLFMRTWSNVRLLQGEFILSKEFN